MTAIAMATVPCPVCSRAVAVPVSFRDGRYEGASYVVTIVPDEDAMRGHVETHEAAA